jgi:hypothetical protein
MQQLWHTVTGGNVSWCDRNTMEKLEGLAPRWSSRDRSVIEAFFDTDQIFSRVNDPTTRAQIRERILTVDGFILTFRTFSKHVKVLRPIMLRLRELVPISDLFPPRDISEPVQRRPLSVKDVLLRRYHNEPSLRVSRCLLQYSEHDERYIETSESAVYSYWQLCLSLIRHEHGPWVPSKRRKGQQEIQDQPEWMIKLGQLAQRLGFESDEITALSCKDADLSRIRLHMRVERPSSCYSVSPGEFDTEARSRQKGQEIFKRRSAFPSPLMTTDSDTSNVEPKTHQGLFLPTIWSALTQDARYALTDFGKLLLILTSFFGDFGPSYASPNDEAPRTKSPPIYSRPIDDGPDHRVANSTAHSPSIYSMPDAPQDQEPARCVSVAYSIPVYPAPSDQPLLTSNAENMVFWRLPASRRIQPTAEYTCKATKDGIKKVVINIQAEGVAPSFTMVDRADKLKLCPSWNIHRRRKSSKRPHDVYYVYGNENVQMWISKKLAKSH